MQKRSKNLINFKRFRASCKYTNLLNPETKTNIRINMQIVHEFKASTRRIQLRRCVSLAFNIWHKCPTLYFLIRFIKKVAKN